MVPRGITVLKRGPIVQRPRTSPFQGEDRSSSLRGATINPLTPKVDDSLRSFTRLGHAYVQGGHYPVKIGGDMNAEMELYLWLNVLTTRSGS